MRYIVYAVALYALCGAAWVAVMGGAVHGEIRKLTIDGVKRQDWPTSTTAAVIFGAVLGMIFLWPYGVWHTLFADDGVESDKR